MQILGSCCRRLWRKDQRLERFDVVRRQGDHRTEDAGTIGLPTELADASSDAVNHGIFIRAKVDFEFGTVPRQNGVSADDEVLNAMLVERGQEFFQVLTEHRGLVPSTDIP
jgi:hypothetical protein